MLKKVYNKFIFLVKKYVFFDKFLWAIHNWFKIRGDENLRINYDLNEKSIVFDVGGYMGDFTYQINKKYNIYVFEPISEFYNIIKVRFEKQKNIKVYNFGLLSYDDDTTLFINDNASSVYSKSINTIKEQIYLKSISEFIKA